MIAALDDVEGSMPFPLLGFDSDNGSQFINHHLLDWCETRKITFTRSRPGNSNDGTHVKQKNWAIVRTVVSHHRYGRRGELLLLNKIWTLQSQLTNYFSPQRKRSARSATAQTPHRDLVGARHDHCAGPAVEIEILHERFSTPSNDMRPVPAHRSGFRHGREIDSDRRP